MRIWECSLCGVLFTKEVRAKNHVGYFHGPVINLLSDYLIPHDLVESGGHACGTATYWDLVQANRDNTRLRGLLREWMEKWEKVQKCKISMDDLCSLDSRTKQELGE